MKALTGTPLGLIFQVALHLIKYFITFIASFGFLSPLNVKEDDLNKNKGHWKTIKDVPGPRCFPFFGSVFTGNAHLTGHLLAANEFHVSKYGDIVKEEHYFNVPILHIYNAKDIEYILKLNLERPPIEILYINRLENTRVFPNVGMVNMPIEATTPWRKMFEPKINSPTFHRQHLDGANAISNDFVFVLSQLAKSPVCDNFEQYLIFVTTEFICHGVIGDRVGFLESENMDQSEMAKLFLGYQNSFWHAFHVSAYKFSWWKHFPSKVYKDLNDSQELMFKACQSLVKNKLEGGDRGQGIIWDLMSNRNMSEEERVLLVMDLIVAGVEPVLNSILFFLIWISKEKEAAAKLDFELRTFLPHKDSQLTSEILMKLKYLNACIKEVFRICPTAGKLARANTDPIIIQDYEIPPWTPIVIQTSYACLQEENFYRAREFLPERWFRDGPNPIFPHSPNLSVPFGMGRKSCPGRRFALHEMMVLLAKVCTTC